jgi:hypothetical protein
MNDARDGLFINVDDCLEYRRWVWSLPESVQGELFRYHYKPHVEPLVGYELPVFAHFNY